MGLVKNSAPKGDWLLSPMSQGVLTFSTQRMGCRSKLESTERTSNEKFTLYFIEKIRPKGKGRRARIHVAKTKGKRSQFKGKKNGPTPNWWVFGFLLWTVITLNRFSYELDWTELSLDCVVTLTLWFNNLLWTTDSITRGCLAERCPEEEF